MPSIFSPRKEKGKPPPISTRSASTKGLPPAPGSLPTSPHRSRRQTQASLSEFGAIPHQKALWVHCILGRLVTDVKYHRRPVVQTADTADVPSTILRCAPRAPEIYLLAHADIHRHLVRQLHRLVWLWLGRSHLEQEVWFAGRSRVQRHSQSRGCGGAATGCG